MQTEGRGAGPAGIGSWRGGQGQESGLLALVRMQKAVMPMGTGPAKEFELDPNPPQGQRIFKYVIGPIFQKNISDRGKLTQFPIFLDFFLIYFFLFHCKGLDVEHERPFKVEGKETKDTYFFSYGRVLSICFIFPTR